MKNTNMSYSIEAWKHSADKDHTTMNWGTLSVDKKVVDSDGVHFYTYSIPMYFGKFDERFHKWVHTAEHLLAYKQDTGSVRNSLEEVSNWTISWKVILDISPYKTWDNTFGFRITSMVPLSVHLVQDFTSLSIQRAVYFLENWKAESPDDFEWIPFARAISCGQFNFHDRQKAISDLKYIDTAKLHIQESEFSTDDKNAYVCDLRFLKPKVSVDDWLIMFSPDFSYKISHIIETKLPEKLIGSIVLVWTFGCMTGMYLCVSSEKGDESDIAYIHSKIIEILKEEIDISKLSEAEKIQFTQLLENYNTYWVKH